MVAGVETFRPRGGMSVGANNLTGHLQICVDVAVETVAYQGEWKVHEGQLKNDIVGLALGLRSCLLLDAPHVDIEQAVQGRTTALKRLGFADCARVGPRPARPKKGTFSPSPQVFRRFDAQVHHNRRSALLLLTVRRGAPEDADALARRPARYIFYDRPLSVRPRGPKGFRGGLRGHGGRSIAEAGARPRRFVVLDAPEGPAWATEAVTGMYRAECLSARATGAPPPAPPAADPTARAGPNRSRRTSRRTPRSPA